MTRVDYLVVGAVVAVFLVVIPAAFYLFSSVPTVYVVYDSEKGDLSYTDTAAKGLLDAESRFSFHTREFTRKDRDILGETIGREKPDLVITVGYAYANLTRQWAKDNPAVRFLAIDQSGFEGENVRAVEITGFGGSYLAGILAAGESASGRVAIVLGTHSPLLDGYLRGYQAGAQAADRNVTVDVAYISDNLTGFSDPVRAAELAGAMYGNGTDVIYAVAGLSGTGVMREAEKSPGRYVIGVDSDQAGLAPAVVLASAVKRVDTVVYTGIEDYLHGTFTTGDEVTGLPDGTTGLVFNPRYASFRDAVMAYEEEAKGKEENYIASRNGAG